MKKLLKRRVPAPAHISTINLHQSKHTTFDKWWSEWSKHLFFTYAVWLLSHHRWWFHQDQSKLSFIPYPFVSLIRLIQLYPLSAKRSLSNSRSSMPRCLRSPKVSRKYHPLQSALLLPRSTHFLRPQRKLWQTKIQGQANVRIPSWEMLFQSLRRQQLPMPKIRLKLRHQPKLLRHDHRRLARSVMLSARLESRNSLFFGALPFTRYFSFAGKDTVLGQAAGTINSESGSIGSTSPIPSHDQTPSKAIIHSSDSTVSANLHMYMNLLSLRRVYPICSPLTWRNTWMRVEKVAQRRPGGLTNSGLNYLT